MRQYGRKPIVQPPHRFVQDKHNQRYGIVLPEENRQGMLGAVTQARKVFEVRTEPIQKENIIAAIEGLRDAVMEAYPAYIDLPEW